MKGKNSSPCLVRVWLLFALVGVGALTVMPLLASPRLTNDFAALRRDGTLIGVQYEVWFTPRNNGRWSTAEAQPLLGRYSSYSDRVVSQHAAWFEYLGLDWVLVDWSNMLWIEPQWEKHRGAPHEFERATNILFQAYRLRRDEGNHPPKIVLLLGLRNGPPIADGMTRLNRIIDWVTRKYLRASQYRPLLLDYDNKPLLVILYNSDRPCQELSELLQRERLIAPDWTVRWMSSQLQTTHADQCGMWSWMDGPVRQIVVKNRDGNEQAVVTPASFYMPGGWLAHDATARRNGVSYIESWKAALDSHPKIIQVHQWNEFLGQKESEGIGPGHDIYGDEYNLDLSDDIEPTFRDRCAYRGCGGWGYYYVNLTKALISLYRHETSDITVMAASVEAGATPNFHLFWISVGETPASYDIQVDGKLAASGVRGSDLDLNLSTGSHDIVVVARGVHTYFDLDPARLTQKSTSPLPVTATMRVNVSPPRH